MPITQAVDDLIHGRLDITNAVQMLLSRPQKEE
jgi:glycerol-3-phosphate dehydrogenase